MNPQENIYSLATYNNTVFSVVRYISKEDFNYYFKEICLIEKVYNDGQLFRLVELNYSDLCKGITDCCNQFSSDPSDYTKIDFQFLNLNRLILNLLSSIRTYLDHSETRLKREYGEQSEEFLLFKRATSEAFDNQFSYRFLSKLRNYSQHCGLPSGSLRLESSENGDELIMCIIKDDLLKNYDSWGIVKSELENQEEQIDILPLIEMKIKLLCKINFEFNKTELKKVEENGYRLLSVIEDVKAHSNGMPCLLKKIDNINQEVKWFPCAAISRITQKIMMVNYTK